MICCARFIADEEVVLHVLALLLNCEIGWSGERKTEAHVLPACWHAPPLVLLLCFTELAAFAVFIYRFLVAHAVFLQACILHILFVEQ